MNELIRIFNDNETHIEIDTVNQKENGMTDNPNIYTYTVLLIDNASGDSIESEVSVRFDEKEIKSIRESFTRAKARFTGGNRYV